MKLPHVLLYEPTPVRQDIESKPALRATRFANSGTVIASRKRNRSLGSISTPLVSEPSSKKREVAKTYHFSPVIDTTAMKIMFITDPAQYFEPFMFESSIDEKPKAKRSHTKKQLSNPVTRRSTRSTTKTTPSVDVTTKANKVLITPVTTRSTRNTSAAKQPESLTLRKLKKITKRKGCTSS